VTYIKHYSEASRTELLSRMEIVVLLDNAFTNGHRAIRKSSIKGNAKKIHFGHGRLSNDGMKLSF
jgi:hypothetical protein